MMKLSRLLKESRLFWPDEISIADGKITAHGHCQLPTLNRTWQRVEAQQDAINEWHQIMSYAIYCALIKQAKHKLRAGDATVVRFHQMDFTYVGLKVKQLLNQHYPSWPRSMRKQFVDDVNARRN